MNFGRSLLKLLLLAGAIVSLGLSYVTSPAAEPPAPPPSAASPQTPPAAAPASPPAAAEPAAQAPATPTEPRLAEAELAQLLAPIALYPDQLLSQILMAATYPLDVVEAARWCHDAAHRRLKGEALAAALRDKSWDPSVKALVPFPHVLEMMNDRIEWTQKLGAAVVAQQADVMNEIQQLRQQAVAAGRFKSGPQCRCVVAQKSGYWTVEPANPEIVYPPVYDAGAIYGSWAYPDYPPYVFPYPAGFAFWPGYYIGYGYGVDVGYYGPLWGWASLNWGGRNIFIDPDRFRAFGRGDGGFAGGVWSHNAAARGAVGGARAAAAGGRGATAAGSAAALGGRGATTGAAMAGGTGARAAAFGGRGAISGRAGWTSGRYAASGHAGWTGGRYATSGHAGWTGGRYGTAGRAAYTGGRGFSGSSGRFGGMAGRGGFHGGGGGYAGHAMIRAGGGGGRGGGGGGMHAFGGGGGGHGGGGGGKHR